LIKFLACPSAATRAFNCCEAWSWNTTSSNGGCEKCP